VVSRVIRTQPRERPTRLDRRAPAHRREPRPSDLLKLEREVALATETAFDAHYRLRPTVRRIAASRLRARAIDLDAPGGAAQEALGPEAWELARPDRPRPRRHDAAGATLAEVEAIVDALEQL
jgi:hypothetical protein